MTPSFHPLADTGIMVTFGDRIDDAVHAQVIALDAALTHAPLPGVTECMPSYTSLCIGYDPLVTDFSTLSAALLTLMKTTVAQESAAQHWDIPACYDAEYAPDLPELADILGMHPDAIADQHAQSTYKVYMYGFAPGYAYLGGVPADIQVPRKPAPVRDVPRGALLIAGPQALITTLIMPSGWWQIGRAGRTPLQDDPDRPFLFSVGDSVNFTPMKSADFRKHGYAQ